ncbi:hypothetical protein EYZ11_001117 [Aspergillus tanneri]|uniref:Translation initiation factor 5A C-terminal domain-containing protein n=1 Tax=Aspergillus tanneri TaxID=1220188 RepID=A0A4S3JVH6_9EURO|nr:hypothetical protein EYZ11_001117 [Aspergillus tanneri]
MADEGPSACAVVLSPASRTAHPSRTCLTVPARNAYDKSPIIVFILWEDLLLTCSLFVSSSIMKPSNLLTLNGHVVIKGRPCKIVDMSTSKTGKHGHAKVHIVALDIFTGKKLEDLSPSTHNMDVPNVTRKEYQLLDITDDDFLSLMDENGNTKDDVKVPDGETGEKIIRMYREEEKDCNVVVLTSMGEEVAIECKEAPK